MGTKPHKHKMKKLITKPVMLYAKGETALGLWDVFTYKVCACGYQSPVNVVRQSTKPLPPDTGKK